MANSRKSLLVLTPRLPYPVIGGDRLRIHRVCRELAKEFDLSLLSLCESLDEMQMRIPLDGVFTRVERVLLPKWRSWLNCLLSLPGRTPLQVAYYRSAIFQKRVDELAGQHDGVLAHLIRTGEYVRNLQKPKFLEMTDAISLNYRRVREVASKARRIQSAVYAIEEQRLGAYERQIVRDFDVAVLVSPVDRAYLFGQGPLAPGNVVVCSNGVDTADTPYQFDQGARDIVFIGNMFSVQNLDAAFYFASEVLPRIRARRPDVRFRVVGRIRQADAARLRHIDGVDVTGEVTSVPVAARGGAVGVCPLRLGAGVQNKILEYMALGLPVVTTTFGAEGLEAVRGREVVVADGDESIAHAVLHLLTERGAAERIARNARSYVEASHSWSARVRPLSETVDRALRVESADGSCRRAMRAQ